MKNIIIFFLQLLKNQITSFHFTLFLRKISSTVSRKSSNLRDRNFVLVAPQPIFGTIFIKVHRQVRIIQQLCVQIFKDKLNGRQNFKNSICNIPKQHPLAERLVSIFRISLKQILVFHLSNLVLTSTQSLNCIDYVLRGTTNAVSKQFNLRNFSSCLQQQLKSLN